MSSANSGWYYEKNGQKNGPFSSSQLAKLAADGLLEPADLVFNPTQLKEWVPARKLKGLFAKQIPSLSNETKTPIPPKYETTGNLTKPDVKDIRDNYTTDLSISKTNIEPPPLDTIDNVSGPNITPESCNQLKALVGNQQWEQAIATGLKPDAIQFWCRVQKAKIQEPGQKNSQSVSGFFKGIKDRVSSTLEQSSVIQSHRFFIITRGKWFLAGQFGFDKQALALDPSDYKLKVTSVDTRIEVEAISSQDTSQVQNFTIFIELASNNPSNCNGNLKWLLENWLLEKSRSHRGETLAPPVCMAASNCEFSNFILPMKNVGPGWVTLRKGKIRFFNDSSELELALGNIASWTNKGSAIEIVFGSDKGIQKIQFLSETGPSEGFATEVTAIASPLEPNSHLKLEAEGNPNGPRQSSYSRYSFTRIADFLEKELPSSNTFGETFVAELDSRSLFGALERPIAIIFDGKTCTGWIGEGAIRNRTMDEGFLAYELSAGCYLQTGSGDFFRIRMPEDSKPIWRLICQMTSLRKTVSDQQGVLAELGSPDDSDFRVVQVNLYQDGSIRLKEGDNEIGVACAKSVTTESDSWSGSYGSIGIGLNGGEHLKLTGSPETILGLWKGRELYDLNERTAGVKLGTLYEEYNSRRTGKFLTGLFGILVVTQQQLDADITLEKFRSEITQAPPGPLPSELGDKLIQKLSILEIARQKISRWLDRCSLFLPHFMSEQERDWLENAFGPGTVDEAKKEKEGRRVQQAIRAELRQVQAALGKPLQELAQNLNHLSFAFPEEVKNPALASIRHAATLAEKGAILTAFGGAGAQLLMDVGRASMGDPFAIAMLGSAGLSLVGKHLQQKAREKEQDIMLRGYGMEAMQWWDVVLDSAFVMALECHQGLDSLHQAGQDRDRKIMEGLSKEKLPIIQKQMAQAIRIWLKNSIESQFYEVLPGSGMFGHHLVKRITNMVRTRSKKVIREFGFELPGS
jgi:hypothetical protein